MVQIKKFLNLAIDFFMEDNRDLVLRKSNLFLTSVSKYTREAGVRTLERKIGAVCRTVAVKVAEDGTEKERQIE